MSFDQLKSKYNMAAKLWIHVEMISYAVHFPYALCEANNWCSGFFTHEDHEPLSS
jgi:hypothetical protein